LIAPSNLTVTGNLISPKIGPSGTQQHTLPVVTSDTIALVAATQTLTNKTLTNPTISGSLTAGNINNVFYVDGSTYPCSDTGINAAIAAAIAFGGAEVDARGCTTLSSWTSEIGVGNAAGVAVTLRLPPVGDWQCGVTAGAGKMCLKVFNNSSVIGTSPIYGGFQKSLQIRPLSNATNVDALCGNDTSVANAHIRMEGFFCDLFSTTATMQKAVGYFSGLGDGAYVGHMTFANLSSTNATKVLWVNDACCSSTFETIVADAFSVVGVTPCWFGNGTTGPNLNIKIDGIACVHPGDGASNLVNEQKDQYGTNVFKNVYMEMGTGTDTTTPWISVRAFGTPKAADYFIGVNAGGDIASSTRYVMDIASSSHVIIAALKQGNISTNLINDHNGGGTLITAAVDTSIGGYSTERQIFGPGTLLSGAAGGTDVGSTSIPFGNIWLGTAATNNFKFQPAATAAARIIELTDSDLAFGRGMVTSTYTNATTTASNVTGLSFAVLANRNYTMACHLYYQGSVGTAGLDITITGPAAPTSVFYSYDEDATSTTFADSVANAFSTKLVGAAAVTATTNLHATVTMGLRNGANAGTVQVQGSATGAGTVTVQAGSFCTLQ
ncbi:MAG: hypothetical protein ACREBG_20615, partial [Pyrinomonadaceae bacterium]